MKKMYNKNMKRLLNEGLGYDYCLQSGWNADLDFAFSYLAIIGHRTRFSFYDIIFIQVAEVFPFLLKIWLFFRIILIGEIKFNVNACARTFFIFYKGKLAILLDTQGKTSTIIIC